LRWKAQTGLLYSGKRQMQQRERREMMIYEVVEGERASQQVRQASRQAGRQESSKKWLCRGRHGKRR